MHAACNDLGYRVGRAQELAHAEVCECRQRCPTCSGLRYVFERQAGYEVAVPCGCVGLAERVRRFNEARIPAGYATKTISGYVGKTDTQRDLKWRFTKYQREIDVHASRGIVLVGPPGTGKTHLVTALLNYLTLQVGIACRFVDFYQLTTRIRQTYDGGDTETEASLIEPLVKVPVLAIDDLGKGRRSTWELTIIDQLVSRRYNAGRIVIATSNYHPERAVSRGDKRFLETLEERTDARIVSRLYEMADIVTIDGPDQRLVAGPRSQTAGDRRSS